MSTAALVSSRAARGAAVVKAGLAGPGATSHPKSGPAHERDPRWSAVLRRDAASDGAFVYAVKTTGIYCRPSCPSRRPKPGNVGFFATCDEAEAAGFRACRRCRPNDVSPGQTHADLVAKACRTIETAERMPTLSALAKDAGLSAFHFHRLFKTITGLTPRGYGAARRASRMRDALAGGADSVTAAIYDAGFGSSSRFYESSNDVLGMTPRTFRAGGTDADIVFAVGTCSLGAILVARTEKGVCAILLGDDPDRLLRELQGRFPKARMNAGGADFEGWVAKAVALVEAPARGFDLPLDIRGTAFQQRVWQALRDIPAGETASYADVARRLGAPKAVRAVASACAANPIAVAIPCHRVVRSDGGLSGYRWGAARKHALLEAEAQAQAKQTVPRGRR
jgi:AraC family transcriptional regulator of adaptative response/methylated-DNA-[protein]-cysteine methyltransferase